MRDGEKEEVYNILQNYNRTWNVEKWKIYSARHPFWFKDLSLKWEDKSLEWYDKINTYWWKQEWFFNYIRDKTIQIPHKKLKDIFGEDITKNKINKIITSGHYSKVVPYWEWTTGKNKSKRSIEYPIWDINQTYDQEYKKWNIKEHYEQKRQKKAWFNYDIEKIISKVNWDVYQEFINNFSKGYKQDLRNI